MQFDPSSKCTALFAGFPAFVFPSFHSFPNLGQGDLPKMQIGPEACCEFGGSSGPVFFLYIRKKAEPPQSPHVPILGGEHGSLEKDRAGWVSQGVLVNACSYLPPFSSPSFSFSRTQFFLERGEQGKKGGDVFPTLSESAFFSFR